MFYVMLTMVGVKQINSNIMMWACGVVITICYRFGNTCPELAELAPRDVT